MDVEMRMPDLATTGSPIKVLRWLVDVGQSVRRGEPLLEVETEQGRHASGIRHQRVPELGLGRRG